MTRKSDHLRPRLPKICSVEGCYRQGLIRGLCSMHYSRWITGVPLDAPLNSDSRMRNEEAKAYHDGQLDPVQ